MKKFMSEGVELAYADEGSGPPVLLIHGLASNSYANWAKSGCISLLRDAGCRAISLDCRGHGESEKLYDASAYSAELMAKDALRLLDHLGIEHADVVGYSMGGAIAAHLGALQPARVRRIILAAIIAGWPARSDSKDGETARSAFAGADRILLETLRNFKSAAVAAGSDFRAMAACLRAAREPIPPAILAGITAPTLLLTGSGDAVGGPASEFAQFIRHARIREIEGRDHQDLIYDPSFRNSIVDFLAESPGPAQQQPPLAAAMQ